MAEEAVKPVEGAAAPAQDGAKANKKKKINRLSLNDITSKIDELAKANHFRSKYYQHLVNRKNDMQPS
jgi:hypothetical protein